MWRLGAPSVRRRRLCARAYLVDLDVGAYPRHQKDCCRGGAVMRGRAGEGDAERWVAAPSKSERRGRARAKKRGQDLPCTRSLRRGAEARADGLGMRGAQRRHPPTHPPTRGAEQSGRAFLLATLARYLPGSHRSAQPRCRNAPSRAPGRRRRRGERRARRTLLHPNAKCGRARESDGFYIMIIFIFLIPGTVLAQGAPRGVVWEHANLLAHAPRHTYAHP